MAEFDNPYLVRAGECLLGADSELVNSRYDNAANRAYFACFQAAIAALQQAGIRAQGGEWSYRFVQSQFDGLLINRRKLYPRELNGILAQSAVARLQADYDEAPVSETEATRAVRRCRAFVEAVRSSGFNQ